MSDSILNESERMIAMIIGHLADGGVTRQTFSVRELGYEANDDSHRLFRDAVLWLGYEGIIASGYTERKNQFSQKDNTIFARSFFLTSKGFKLLSEKFDGELTLGAAVKEANSNGTGYANAGTFFGGILGGFTKSISG
ncbi:hypothetical protein [Tropicibacter sp. S64]|uniref:hypothetical protein n=1 Tax=Tropicibacter sp. S64 TaxID=3415122 RepID=UPI003C7D1E91